MKVVRITIKTIDLLAVTIMVFIIANWVMIHKSVSSENSITADVEEISVEKKK